MDSDRDAALLKYSELWEYRDYEDHSFCEKGLIKSVIAELGMDKKEHITDWGCGAGLTAKTFIKEGFFVHGIDIAPNCLAEEMKDFPRFYFSEQCLWALTEKVTKTPWFICTYVLEHLPEKKLHAVLYQIHKRTEYGGLFVISLIEDEFGPKSINQGLHLTVRAARWWYDQLSRYWDVTYDTHSDYMLIYAIPKKETNDYAGSWPVY
jgi:2-polyprenyl-3-methyl-5-hydroxy-6-metoxy-1,4-benzoquinol methylase